MKTVKHPRSNGYGIRFWLGSVLSVLSRVSLAGADAGTTQSTLEPRDIISLSIDELGSINVTSVSKKSEKLNEVPAAVSVITGDDIRRSGAITLPQALRLAAGVQVGRVDSAESAVSVRGFNDTYSQKLLVLMDGRSIYTPLFSGTFWQAQDTLLEDVDRIEVIRGPGGTVWGANAVNGVINIVSKPSRETQGMLLTGGGGTDRLAFTGLRYGAPLGENTYFRIYGKYDDWNNSTLAAGGKANDAWWKGQGGYRIDWEPSTSDRFTLQGDLFGLQMDLTSPQVVLPNILQPPPPTGYYFARAAKWDQNGGNILGRWSHQFSEESDFSVQTYYDRGRLNTVLMDETRDTFDLDFRQRFQLGSRDELVWGGGYRLSEASIADGAVISLSKKSRADQIFNAFVQDEIKIVPERLRLTMGTKVEHNDYTGLEYEPSGRLSWTPTEKQTVWASVARAVRTPSQIEHDASINIGVLPPNPPTSPLPTVVTVTGTPKFRSETLVAYEMGYRIQIHRRLTLDVAGFYNDYDELRSTTSVVDPSQAPNYIQVRNVFTNAGRGRTYGGEVVTTWQTLDWWRLQAQLTVIDADLHEPANNLTGAPNHPSISSPTYQVSLRSSMDLGKHVELDAWLRFTEAFTSPGVSASSSATVNARIPSYTTLDLRIAWHATKNLEIALVGQNLAGDHREFNPTFVSTSVTEIGRSVYGKVSYKF